MRKEQEKTQQGVQSVEVGMCLARCLAAAPEARTLKQLAEAAGMPSAKAHRYLVSLIRTGLVVRHPLTGKYDLGPVALEMGLAALGRLDWVELATHALHRLHEAVDETVLLAVWGNRGPTVIRWLESSRPVTVNVRVGSVMPLLTSATGRTFLAYLPRSMTAGLVAAELQDPRTPIRSREEVDSLAESVRARGMARVRGDLLPGIAALGVPVFDHQAEPVAVLTALGGASAFDHSWDGVVARSLTAEARQLSVRLGYRGP